MQMLLIVNKFEAVFIVNKTNRHVVNDPVVLVVHAHPLLDEVQFGEVVGLVRIVTLRAHLAASAGTLVEEDLKIK